ncbi:hypothetical protein XMA121_001549 [Marinobacterium sp. xm-a-121]|nr:hypothetical protein [Marinobacterium sp. xm-a-121]NRP99744.1 hypothetical protein [Marinobacterium sp. xm-v-233]
MSNLVAEFNSKTILHSQLKTAIKAISNTHSMSGIVGTGMLLLGPSGVGKTKILENYTKTYLGSLRTSPWHLRLTVKFIIKACFRRPSGLSRESTTLKMDLTVSPAGRDL